MHQCDGEPGERAELRTDHHCPDDQNQRVRDDPECGDHGREDHEGEEADRKLCALGCLLLHRLPDDGVGRRTDCLVLGASGGPRNEGRDRFKRDRALALQAELAELCDNDAGVLTCHVTEEEIALGALGRTAKPDEIQRRGMLAKGTERVIGELRWGDDAEVDHRRCSPGSGTKRYPMRASVRK